MAPFEANRDEITHIVILLHGYQSNGNHLKYRFMDTLKAHQQRAAKPTSIAPFRVTPHTHFLFPDAPFDDPGGGKSWVLPTDEHQHSRGVFANASQIGISVARFRLLLDRVLTCYPIPERNIFIGGYDQGFAVALAAFLVEGHGRLGGIFGWSSWMPCARNLMELGKLCVGGVGTPAWIEMARDLFCPAGASENPLLGCIDPVGFRFARMVGERITPFLVMHSVDDRIVAVRHGAHIGWVLTQMGLKVDYVEMGRGTTPTAFDDAHWIAVDEGIDELFKWLDRNG